MIQESSVWLEVNASVHILVSAHRNADEEENVPSWDHTVDYREWKLVITGDPFCLKPCATPPLTSTGTSTGMLLH